jgi:hypothetical protein
MLMLQYCGFPSSKDQPVVTFGFFYHAYESLASLYATEHIGDSPTCECAMDEAE